MEKPRPIFIVVEGIDGTGKSTFVNHLAQTLGCCSLKSPPDELGGVREMFDENDVAHKLFYASVNAIVSEQACALLTRGESVICDRYWLSTKVYSSVRETDIDLDHIEQKLSRPDLTIYLYADEQTRQQRMARRGMNNIDRRSVADVEALRAAYDTELTKEFSGQVLRLNTGTASPAELVNEVMSHIRPFAS